MSNEEIISGLEALLQQAKVADRKINYSSQVYRLERKVKEMEEELIQLKKIVEVLYIQNNKLK